MQLLASSLGGQIACKMAARQPELCVRRVSAVGCMHAPHSAGQSRFATTATCSCLHEFRHVSLLTGPSLGRFASLLLVGTAQGWQLALTTALRQPLVSGAMLLGQLPGLHRLAICSATSGCTSHAAAAICTVRPMAVRAATPTAM